ncbi:Ger(x)C family spore germination protein [Cohnella silvisoli]|uniref:Ger(X)C family spore germination protein n=1 Tax=Cohnella silvisoli TaxID=2873699 RepID=A0ABV1KT33_9BACL|nr:Ger(x)C family spore germination protein [Cohnella silvisoli]
MKAFLIGLILLVFCTGCWDMKEINALAIVSLAGVDKNPETGEYTAYYQVINPTGLSTRQGSSARAAVYTYNFKDFSLGRFTDRTSRVMPRKFFTAHLQSYIISERYARQGILDFINFIELNPERRANVVLYISDSPMNTIMNSFTPLDRVPGRFIRSLTNLVKPSFSMGTFPIRIKEMAKELHLHTPTVVPIVHYAGENPSSTTNRLEEIDVSKNGMKFGDGAVFIHARMVGRIDETSKTLYLVLNKKLMKYTETVKINGDYVDVEAQNVRVKRKWEKDKHTSLFALNIKADLRILNNQQKSKMTVQNLRQIETSFNQRLEERIESFERMGKEKGWDLLGIQDNGGNEMTWRQTKVNIHINSRMTAIGNTSTPYHLE